MVSFILSATFSVIKILPQRDSAKSQLLRLYTQFSFTKKLRTGFTALHTRFKYWNILEEHQKALLKIFFTDVDRLMLPRRPQDVTFK